MTFRDLVFLGLAPNNLEEDETMKKIFVLFLAALVLISGQAFAGSTKIPAYEKIVIEDARGGDAAKPVQVVKRVRYGEAGAVSPGLSSGDCVSWDLTSADGVTVTKYDASAGTGNFAGILVTDLLTQDSGAAPSASDNWGYVCVRGYCLASADASIAAGFRIKPSATYDGAVGAANAATLSGDIGVCLETMAAGSLKKVMLY